MLERATQDDDNLIMNPGEGEIARLTLQHKVIKHYMKNLILAPIDLSQPGLHILDQASADGLWLRDVASSAPVQHVYVGTDIVAGYFPSKPQPGMSFQIQSMNDPFPTEWKNVFDVVHSKFSLPGAGHLSMQNIINSEVGVLKPGGWLQHMELQLEDYPDLGPAMTKAYQVISDVFDAVGVGHTFSKSMRKLLEDAGLEEIHSEVITIPLGAKELGNDTIAKDGALSMVANVASIVAGAKYFASAMSVPPAEIDSLVNDVREELETVGGEWRFPVVWGRKPFE